MFMLNYQEGHHSVGRQENPEIERTQVSAW